MLLQISQQEFKWLLRLEGQVTVAAAAELKGALIEWLGAHTNLDLDLEATEEIDIAAIQLLYAAGREAARKGLRIDGRVSSVVSAAIRDSGFDKEPWLAFKSQ
jgi:ABC-type transporter Mla MlaB component